MDTPRCASASLFPHVAFFLSLTAFLASCASRPETVRLYEGQQLPAQEVAYLVGDEASLCLHSVDGRMSPSGRRGYGSSWDGTYRLEILPGEHTLTVSLNFRTTSDVISNRFTTHEIYYSIQSVDNVDIRLSFEPGRTYVLTSEWDFEGKQWFPTVIDQTKNQTVFQEGPYRLKTLQVGDFFKSPGGAMRRY
jgi:hypothetical protein